MPTTKPRRIVGGEKSLNDTVQATLLAVGAPPSLRASVAVDHIIRRLERTYPKVLTVPRERRWLIPMQLVHPSIRDHA